MCSNDSNPGCTSTKVQKNGISSSLADACIKVAVLGRQTKAGIIFKDIGMLQ